MTMPLDTETVIANAIADLGDQGPADGGSDNASLATGGDDGATSQGDVGGAAGDSGAAGAATPGEGSGGGDDATGVGIGGTTAAAPAAKAADDEDPILKEAGFSRMRGDGKENRIPYSAVTRIVRNQVEKGLAAKQTEWEATNLQPIQAKYAALERESQEFQQLKPLIEGPPEKFLDVLAHAYPQYQALVARLKAPVAPPAPPVAETFDEAMPQPDLPLGDGRFTYSQEGHQKVLDWQDRRAEWKANKAIADRFRPLDEAEAQRKETEAQTARARAIETDARGRIQQTLDDAVANWPGFKENSDAIGELVMKQGLDLHGAYRTVILGARDARIKELEAAVAAAHENALKSIKGAPAATAVPKVAPAVVAGGEKMTTEQVIAASIRNLKR